MKNIPKEFELFCIEYDLEYGHPIYALAKEAWNKAISLASHDVAMSEGMDFGISDYYTIIDEHEELRRK